jgi:hypothetical protein
MNIHLLFILEYMLSEGAKKLSKWEGGHHWFEKRRGLAVRKSSSMAECRAKK